MANFYESDRELYERFVRCAGDVMIDAMRRAGLKGEITLPSYDELIASGAPRAAEYQLQSMDFVTPGWRRRAARRSKKRPLAVIPGGKDDVL